MCVVVKGWRPREMVSQCLPLRARAASVMEAAFAFLGLCFLLIWIMFILPVVLAWRFCTAWPLLSPGRA